MSVMNHYFRDLPDYYDTMYMDGYSPEQILHTARQTMIRDYEARKAAQQAEAEANEIPNEKIFSESKGR